MGDRVASKSESSKKERSAEVTEKMERSDAKRRKKTTARSGGGTGEGIFSSSTILEGSATDSVYRPSNPNSREAHSNLVDLLSSKEYLGSQPREVLTSAAEEVLTILKSRDEKDPQKKVELGRLLTGSKSISDGVYNKLVLLGRQMDDYEEYRDRELNVHNDKDANMDDEMGVAVVFNDSEEENEGGEDEEGRSDVEEDVVVDINESSDEEKDSDNGSDVDDEVDEERLVQGVGGKKKTSNNTRVLSVHEIDAHYLQRRLGPSLEDADAAESARLSDEILSVLDFRGGTSIRECENQLLVLLGFERFDLIKLLLANRVRIWGCVSIKRATDEITRDAVEKSLEEEESGEGRRTLEELRSRSMAEDWKGERMKSVRDDTLRKKEVMDKEDDEGGDGATKMSKALDSIQVRSKEGEDVDMEDTLDSSKVAHELDLESLIFRDGNHTMTNKKCDLPDKSWRAMKPGYEEVHVPAVRSIPPAGEKLVPIGELPEWTHDAFKGMKSLNRVQSKLADVALKTSENILLCAPTGAGKTNVAM